MPTYRITAPDGKTYEVTGNGTAEEALAHIQSTYKPEPQGYAETLGAGLGKGFGQVVLNAQELAGKGIEALGGGEPTITDLVAPRPNVIQRAGRWLQQDAQQGKAKIEAELAPYKAANPITAGAGEIGGNIVATLPVTAGLGSAVGTVAPRLGAAIGSAGMSTGAAPVGALAKAADLGIRTAGGAINGGVSAGLVDPSQAGTGAVIGSVLPGAVQLAGAAGQAIGKAVRGGGVAPEVKTLADRASQLGIDIPADRLVNSKPLDAVASGLNYVPFSGRAATEAKMGDQLNRALSRTFGQNSPNVTQSLRRAEADLGGKFDTFLRGNSVSIDKQFLTDLADAGNQAAKELEGGQAGLIQNQIDEIIAKGANGQIDGQAAYNIKKTLDRIGNRNSPEAWYALDLKQKLMSALDRSVGPQASADFKALRQQYGNMLALQKIAKNGAEGDISVARLANMKGINNPDLQELADIAAQFVKPREGQHGAMQRAVAGLVTAGTAGPVGIAGLAGGGRLANTGLNSQALRELVSRPQVPFNPADVRYLSDLVRSAPVIAASASQ